MTNKRLFHISEHNLDNETIVPRIPRNFFTQNGYEENETKRISFSSSVHGCIMGVNCHKDNIYYVHEPVDYSKIKTKKPSTSEVPDCRITGEVWVLNNVKLTCIGIIKTKSPIDAYHSFKYGDNTTRLYDWNYDWIRHFRKK